MRTPIKPAPLIRILAVFAALGRGSEPRELAAIVGALDPARFRVKVVSCLDVEGHGTDARYLSGAGADVDLTPHGLSMADTVAHLLRQMARHDVVISFQNAPDLIPAMTPLAHRPFLIEYGSLPSDPAAGPKHLTSLYVAANEPTRQAAIAATAGADVILIPPILVSGNRAMARARAARQWELAFEQLLARRRPAPVPSVFAGFWQGGFECSTHRLASGRRLDVTAAIGHDANAAQDYRQLQGHGIRTVRDGLRWHLIEGSPGRYDFASFTPMLKAAKDTGTQVIWDLHHYGWPDDIDPWRPAFVDRFAAFAAAAARHVHDQSDAVPFWCPINEISFQAWGGGDVGYLNPFGRGRGMELKVQLIRAAIAAMHAVRDVDPRARFVHCEPAIAIHPDPGQRDSAIHAENLNDSQFEAFDMLGGLRWPGLGGDPSFLDILGINYYFNNQRFLSFPIVEEDHPVYRPVDDLITDVYARYGRPVVISETGIEGDRRAGWLSFIADAVLRARARGVPVEGLCLYPVADHPGWDDDRYCPNGLLGAQVGTTGRPVHAPLAAMLAELQARWTAAGVFGPTVLRAAV